MDAWQGNVNTNSSPSDLRITDMRYCVLVNAPMRCPIIRIDTNQGISGYGEVRDGWLLSDSLCEGNGVRIITLDKFAVDGLHNRHDVFLACSAGRPVGVVVSGEVGRA